MPKSLLLIGGSSAIGQAIVNAVHDDYDKIIVHAHQNLPDFSGVSYSAKMRTLSADLRNEADIKKLCQLIEMEIGTPNDIVHLSAPPAIPTPFKKLALKDFKQHMNIQVYAFVEILSYFLPKMAKRKSGNVVALLSSVTLGVPPKGLAHYTTAKYALLGLVKSLASEYASKGVRLNAISPSMMDTPYLNELPKSVIEAEIKAHPLGRLATPGDLIPLFKVLLGTEHYLQGVNLPVTGGIHS